ncbi:histone-lysine N-methyltransferase SETMAR [Trichonephila clavipes]|nr:histone-lysine N-methyltransferase SETMAR [Trichonephila clavipes]
MAVVYLDLMKYRSNDFKFMLVVKVTFHTKIISFLFGPFNCELQGVKNGSQQRENSGYILQFFFDKDEKVSQAAEIVNSIYGAHTVTANYVKFWFRPFHSGIFDVKNAPHIGSPVVENVDKMSKIIGFDGHVSSRSITQELKNDHKTALNHLRQVRIKTKLDVWLPHQLIPKNMMD